MSYRIPMLTLSASLLVALSWSDADAGHLQQKTQSGPANTTAEAPLQGRLEIVWGDPQPGSSAAHTTEVNLVDDAGRRHALDLPHALRAAGDLNGLYGRRVAVSRMPQPVGKAVVAGGPLLAETIVPIDDLRTSAYGRSETLAASNDIATNAVTGTTVWVTLMCKFKDIAVEPQPKSFFQAQYGNSAGRLGHYWSEVSYKKINLNGSSAHGWFTLPQPRSYYITKNADGSERADLVKLFEDCTQVADASVNFAANGGVTGINMMFNATLGPSAWGGGRCATLESPREPRRPFCVSHAAIGSVTCCR